MIPGDPGWGTGTAIGSGAFVDLYYSSYVSGATSTFSGVPYAKSKLNAVGGFPVMPTYDTWSFYYERNPWIDSDGDGVFDAGEPGDEDGDGILNEGTDGFDNDGVNGVDDLGERETSPPYPIPLRGLQVRIRIYEPDTRQVRQSSVSANFVPD